MSTDAQNLSRWNHISFERLVALREKQLEAAKSQSSISHSNTTQTLLQSSTETNSTDSRANETYDEMDLDPPESPKNDSSMQDLAAPTSASTSTSTPPMSSHSSTKTNSTIQDVEMTSGDPQQQQQQQQHNTIGNEIIHNGDSSFHGWESDSDSELEELSPSEYVTMPNRWVLLYQIFRRMNDNHSNNQSNHPLNRTESDDENENGNNNNNNNNNDNDNENGSDEDEDSDDEDSDEEVDFFDGTWLDSEIDDREERMVSEQANPNRLSELTNFGRITRAASNHSVEMLNRETDYDDDITDLITRSRISARPSTFTGSASPNGLTNNGSTLRQETEVSPFLPMRKRLDQLKQKYAKEKVIKSIQPGAIYKNSLNLEFKGAQLLDIMGHPPTMENIAASSKLYPMFFLADSSRIRVYTVDAPSSLLEYSAVLSFETKPDRTTEEMRAGAIYSYHPHSITRLITGFLRNNEIEVLVSASDNGRVHVWDTKVIYQKFKAALNLAHKKSKSPDVRGTIFLKSFTPKISFQLPQSTWGLAIHKRLNLLAASCNEGCIYIFSLDKVFGLNKHDSDSDVDGYGHDDDDLTEPIAISPDMQHNIPDVEFIDPSPEDVAKGLYRNDAFYLNCVTIMGYTVMCEFFMGRRLKRFQKHLDRSKFESSLMDSLDATILFEKLKQARSKKQQQKPQEDSSSSNGNRRSSNERSRRVDSSSEDETEDEPIRNAWARSASDSDDNEDDDSDTENELLASYSLEDLRVTLPGEKVDPFYLRVPFEYGRWMIIEELDHQLWSVNSFSEEDFLPVENLFELSGNQWFTEANVFKQHSWSVYRRCAIPGLNRKPQEEALNDSQIKKSTKKNKSEDANAESNTKSVTKTKIDANTNANSTLSPSQQNKNSPFGVIGPGGYTPASTEILPMSQEFVDFAMRFWCFSIIVVPLSIFSETVKVFNLYSEQQDQDQDRDQEEPQQEEDEQQQQQPQRQTRNNAWGSDIYSPLSASSSSASINSIISRPHSSGSSVLRGNNGNSNGLMAPMQPAASNSSISTSRTVGNNSNNNNRPTLGLLTANSPQQSRNPGPRTGQDNPPVTPTAPIFVGSRGRRNSIGSINRSPSVGSLFPLSAPSPLSPTSPGAGMSMMGSGYGGSNPVMTLSQHRQAKFAESTESAMKALQDWYISSRTSHPLASSFSHGLLKSPPLNNQFLLLTTRKSVHLCRAESFIMNAAENNVFGEDHYLDSSMITYDRLCLIVPVPGLNAVVVASQLGSVSLMRLVRYKSLFTLRQEFVFPVHEMFIYRTPRLRTITGIDVVPIYNSGQDPKTVNPRDVKRYRINIIYLDGFLLSYELSNPVDEEYELFGKTFDSYV